MPRPGCFDWDAPIERIPSRGERDASDSDSDASVFGYLMDLGARLDNAEKQISDAIDSAAIDSAATDSMGDEIETPAPKVKSASPDETPRPIAQKVKIRKSIAKAMLGRQIPRVEKYRNRLLGMTLAGDSDEALKKMRGIYTRALKRQAYLQGYLGEPRSPTTPLFELT